MIRSKAMLHEYLDADRKALGASTCHPLVQSDNSMVWLTDPVYRWQRLLRRLEYWENCHPGRLLLPLRIILRWRFQRLGTRLGLSIPLNVAGPGLCVLHYGSIVVSRHAKLGKGVVLNSCVNIGVHHGGAPEIGDGVYVGPDAKLFGPICIADGVKVGANAVVLRSCEIKGATIVGVPAMPVVR